MDETRCRCDACERSQSAATHWPSGQPIGRSLTGETLFAKYERGALARPVLREKRIARPGLFDVQETMYADQADERARAPRSNPRGVGGE